MTKQTIGDAFDNMAKAIAEHRQCTTCDDEITFMSKIENQVEFLKTGQCKGCQMVGGIFPPKNRTQETVEMNEEVIKERLSQTNIGSFKTNTKTEYVEEKDNLELEIKICLNVKHSRYNEFYTELKELLYNGRREQDLVRYLVGV